MPLAFKKTKLETQTCILVGFVSVLLFFGVFVESVVLCFLYFVFGLLCLWPLKNFGETKQLFFLLRF